MSRTRLCCGAVVFLAFLAVAARGSLVNDNIYTTLTSLPCTRLLNVDGEIGCTTNKNGNVGALYQISTPAELAAFADASEPAYIALITQAQFAGAGVFAALKSYSHCKGILIYDEATYINASTGWSPDSTRPNAASGLPYAPSAVAWNPAGSGIHWEDLDFPVFLLDPRDYATVFAMLAAHGTEYPRAAVELSAWMHGGGDADTCLRRSYCDPLGGRSIIGALGALNASREVVLLAAPLDTLDLFHDRAWGLDADAASSVAVVAAAHVLGSPANAAAVRALPRTIAAALFQGEAFGYGGSTRFFRDLYLGRGLANVSVSHMLEARQLLRGDGADLFAYAYQPAGQPGPSAAAQQSVDALASGATAAGLTVTLQAASDLPPASLRAALHELRDASAMYDFGGVVLTDHDHTGFSNKFYNSRYDSVDYNAAAHVSNEASAVTVKVCRVAETLARAAWAVAGGIANASAVPLDTTGLCARVAALLDCVAVNGSCALAQTYLGAGAGALAGDAGPMSRYVGVYSTTVSLTKPAAFFLAALADAVAENRSAAGCTADSAATQPVPPAAGDFLFADGRCARSTTYLYDAVSPAFKSDYTGLLPEGTAPDYLDGRDPRWPTWTESRWDSVNMRLFLLESPRREGATLGCGLAFLGACFAVVYLLVTRTEQLTPISVAADAE